MSRVFKELTDRPALRQTMDDDSNRALARTLVAYRSVGGSTWWGNVVGRRWDENCPTHPTDPSPRDWMHFFRAKKIVDSRVSKNWTRYFGVFQEIKGSEPSYFIEFRDSTKTDAQCLGVAKILHNYIDIDRKIQRAEHTSTIELLTPDGMIKLTNFTSLEQKNVLWATKLAPPPRETPIMGNMEAAREGATFVVPTLRSDEEDEQTSSDSTNVGDTASATEQRLRAMSCNRILEHECPSPRCEITNGLCRDTTDRFLDESAAHAASLRPGSRVDDEDLRERAAMLISRHDGDDV